MCKELDKVKYKYSLQVDDKIESFEGNIYTSAQIPIVIKIQQLWREKQKRRREEEQHKNPHKAKVGDSIKKQDENDDLLESSEESEEDARDFIQKKQKQMIGLKQRLDRMISNVQDDNKYGHCTQHLHIDNSDPSIAPPEDESITDARKQSQMFRRASVMSHSAKKKNP